MSTAAVWVDKNTKLVVQGFTGKQVRLGVSGPIDSSIDDVMAPTKSFVRSRGNATAMRSRLLHVICGHQHPFIN